VHYLTNNEGYAMFYYMILTFLKCFSNVQRVLSQYKTWLSLSFSTCFMTYIYITKSKLKTKTHPQACFILWQNRLFQPIRVHIRFYLCYKRKWTIWSKPKHSWMNRLPIGTNSFFWKCLLLSTPTHQKCPSMGVVVYKCFGSAQLMPKNIFKAWVKSSNNIP
jgi:hypothetical protein